jgi:hypothetical protein
MVCFATVRPTSVQDARGTSRAGYSEIVMRLILAILLALPLIASATPATITAQWDAVPNAATYELACGFQTDALNDSVTTDQTTAALDVVLPTDAGTAYCGLTAFSAGGLASPMSELVSGDWSITELPPAQPTIIDIGISVDCPEGFECVVTLQP